MTSSVGQTEGCSGSYFDGMPAAVPLPLGSCFGTLTTISVPISTPGPKGGKPRRRVRCRCACGSILDVTVENLRSGHM
jgi:hypothetical protein